MVPFPVTLSDPKPKFQGHGVIRPIDALNVLCAQLRCDLFTIAKFLLLLLTLLSLLSLPSEWPSQQVRILSIHQLKRRILSTSIMHTHIFPANDVYILDKNFTLHCFIDSIHHYK